MKLIHSLKEKVRKLKGQVQVLIIVYADRRTPLAAKMVIGLTVAYLLSPIDLIPDFIPILGLLDDLVIVPLLIVWSIKLIPPQILAEARQRVKENPAQPAGKNWIFAMMVIAVWLFIMYFLYTQFREYISL